MEKGGQFHLDLGGQFAWIFHKEDWNRIIDVASQTKILVNLELANVRAIRSAIVKKEKVKEQALIRAYESIKKLKKFGIIV